MGDKLVELRLLIREMDVPAVRRHPPDVRWLNRNLGARNSEHENFDKAMKLIKELIKEGW